VFDGVAGDLGDGQHEIFAPVGRQPGTTGMTGHQPSQPGQLDRLVEAGAGRGILMRDLLDALGKEKGEAARTARPAIVEVSPRLREQQALALEGRELRWASVARTLAPIRGIVFANEVLDAFPVHVMVRSDDGVREVYVDAKDGALVETLRAPSHPDLRYRVPESLPVGGRWEVSLGAESWVAQLAAALAQGYLVIIDYGGEEVDLLSRGGAGTVRGFSRHRLIADALAAPGAHDLTASVNLTAIRRAAEGAGLTFAGNSFGVVTLTGSAAGVTIDCGSSSRAVIRRWPSRPGSRSRCGRSAD